MSSVKDIYIVLVLEYLDLATNYSNNFNSVHGNRYDCKHLNFIHRKCICLMCICIISFSSMPNIKNKVQFQNGILLILNT